MENKEKSDSPYIGGHINYNSSVNNTNKKELSPMSKLVYLSIKFMKDREKVFDPSYKFMENRFGINRSAYRKALKQLRDLNFIKYWKIKKGNHEYLEIKILTVHDKDNRFEMIPSIFIQSPALNHEQKMLLSTIWKDLLKNHTTQYTFTIYSANMLFELNKEIGLSEKVFSRTMKQLTNSDSGFVNVFTKESDRYILNYISILELVEINEKEWSDHKGRSTYPVYKEPIKGDFIMKERRIFDNRTNNQLERNKLEEKRAIGAMKRATGLKNSKTEKKRQEKAYEKTWKRF